MEKWLRTCLILCCYGFFKELRPSEPFLTEYLLGPEHNLTEEEVYYMIYPVWTYSYLSLLVLVFLLTDLLRYKPVIVFESIGYIATWCLLIWARGVRWMQFMEFCYGIATSTEVAYFTYIYAKVDAKYYQRVTSYTRTAFLFGRFMSGILAQILVSTGLMDYYTLNYFTLTSECIAFCFAIMLPPVTTSIYFHREKDPSKSPPPIEEESVKVAVEGSTPPEKGENASHSKEEEKKHRTLSYHNFKKVAYWLWDDFKAAYSNRYLLKWSIWWAFATCINYQVGNYIQPLWESVAPFEETDKIYNGLVEAISTLLGSISVFAVGYFRLNWVLFGEATLAILSLIDGFLLFFMGLTDNIWVAYVNYIAFRVSYMILITIASYQVAKNLREDSYGLVFGINMFVALLLQTLLTLVVIEALQLDPGLQFVVYGCYLFVLSWLFFTMAGYSLARLGLTGIKRMGIWEKATPSQPREEVSESQTQAENL